MRKWSSLVFGLLLTTTVACSPINEFVPTPTSFSPVPTPTPFILERPTDPIPTPPATLTNVPAVAEEAEAVIQRGGSGRSRQLGDVSNGIQLRVPVDWLDLLESANQSAGIFNTRFGLPTLFGANSERTARALLAGKPLEDGAYVVGMVSSYQLPNDNPAAGLEHLLADLAIPLPDKEVVPFIRLNDGNGLTAVAGAYIDVVGASPFASSQPLQTRILLFTVDAPTNPSQIIFFFGAAPEQWESYEGLFMQMAQTIDIHQVRPSLRLGNGAVAVVGELVPETAVSRTLNPRGRDLWTFRVEGQQYITFAAKPSDSNLDLALHIFDPAGQIIATIDNGFAGDTEIVTDLALDDPGVYVVEVSDFSTAVGNYELRYDLSKTPLYQGGGGIAYGQSIQSNLPPNNQHVWSFSGIANQLVSVVLTPNDETFDAILDLYGPDGTRLVALDEGFSGDAEVISGFELPLTGEYSILVRNFAGGTGAYSLALDQGGESTLNFYDAGDLLYGDVKEETLRPNEAQAWFFAGRPEDNVMVKVSPIDAHLDLEVWVLDPNINRLIAVDSFMMGQPEMVDLTLSEEGEHIVLVRDFFGRAGAYQIQLQATQVAAPPVIGRIGYGQTAVNALEAESSVAWSFIGEVGDTIDVTLEGDAASYDLVLHILAPDGQTVLTLDEAGSNEPEQLTRFTLSANGRWQLVVEEFYGQPVTYSLLLETAD